MTDWKVLAFTTGIAFAIALLQLWLKLLSRRPPPGKNHGLVPEDFVWWIEWVVAASVALALTLIVASYNGRVIPFSQVLSTIIALLCGFSILPYLAKVYAYDKNGQVKGWREIVVMNVLGMLILLSAVAAGVKAYG
jgi:hypothetical protein